MASAGDPTYDRTAATGENRSLLSVLRRRSWIIVAVTLFAGAAALGIAYASRDAYESTAKILFQQTISPEINAIGLLPTSLDADNLARNNVEVVGSRTVAAATARDLHGRGEDTSVDEVDDDVSVSGETQSDVVNVVATASSARGAAQLASIYAEQAVRFVEGNQRQSALRALRELRSQLAAMPAHDRKGTEGRRLRANAEKIRTVAAVGPGNPQVIQQGFLPDAKKGNLLQTTVLGLLFGLVLGIGLALLREQADRRLRRPEDVSAAFDAPVLTTVPRDRKLRGNVPFEELPAKVSEAFRMLQMNLFYGHERPVHSVLVTSARSGEGKTTVAWNLALAASSAGFSVAVIEADLRRPTIAQRYGLQPKPGLVEAIRGEISASEALQPVSTASASVDANGAAHVLVAGSSPPDPWTLMQSAELPRILQLVTDNHDLVIVDASPIPHVADAISLLRQVDGVLVTASVNSTRGSDAGRLRDQLQALDARVLGVVANRGSTVGGYAHVVIPSSTNSPGGDGHGRGSQAVQQASGTH